MGLGGHSETEGGQELLTCRTSDSGAGAFLLLTGESARWRARSWLAVKLGHGVQWLVMSLSGGCALATLEQPGSF